MDPESGTTAWTPKVCKLMTFWAVFKGFGPLFYRLWGSRYVTMMYRQGTHQRSYFKSHLTKEEEGTGKQGPIPRPLHVPLFMALWSPLDDSCGVLKASGVLVLRYVDHKQDPKRRGSKPKRSRTLRVQVLKHEVYTPNHSYDS